MERLQKVMAEAGVASRRQCEQMIREGLVKVNGRVAAELPVLVDAGQDVITVGGKRLRLARKVYYLLYKPKGVITTNYDPQGRRKTADLLTGVRERVYAVGRLDAESKGLLILTNDGELANKLTHPRYGVERTYLAEISGELTGAEVETLRKGVYLAEGRARAERVRVLRRGRQESLVEITLRGEGRNRQVQRMLARLGHGVRQLTRVRMGPLTLRGLGAGKFRRLTAEEEAALHSAVGPAAAGAEGSKGGEKGAKRSVAVDNSSKPKRVRGRGERRS